MTRSYDTTFPRSTGVWPGCATAARRPLPGCTPGRTSRRSAQRPVTRRCSRCVPGPEAIGGRRRPGSAGEHGRGRDARRPLHVRDQHRDLVRVAPAPLRARLERADQHVLARAGVGGGVLVGRVVAAADVPARQADAQVQPLAAGGEALLAAVDGLRELGDRDLVEVGAVLHAAFFRSIGRRTVNAVAPGRDSTRSEPSWRSATIRRAVASPRPVPWPTSLVVKNGSKSRSRTSSGIPGPSSATVTSRHAPSRRVLTVIVPEPSSASIALSSRFVHTWLSSEPWTVTRGRSLS